MVDVNLINKLRTEGKTYKEIANILHCSTCTISYHLSPGQKDKQKQRVKKNKIKEHPYIKKIQTFNRPTYSLLSIKQKNTWKRLMSIKASDFNKVTKHQTCDKGNVTLQEVLDKIGDNPICYLTGEPIDIYSTRSYEFDHIVPRYNNGQNTIDNLGVCSAKANKSKGNMSLDEYITLCEQVLKHHGYKIEKPNTT